MHVSVEKIRDRARAVEVDLLYRLAHVKVFEKVHAFLSVELIAKMSVFVDQEKTANDRIVAVSVICCVDYIFATSSSRRSVHCKMHALFADRKKPH